MAAALGKTAPSQLVFEGFPVSRVDPVNRKANCAGNLKGNPDDLDELEKQLVEFLK